MTASGALGALGAIDEHSPQFASGFKALTQPLQALTMVYPSPAMDDVIERGSGQGASVESGSRAECLGKVGLERTMTFVDHSSRVPPEKFDFDYRPEVLARHGRIFARENIGKYSGKIANVCESVARARGIVVVYAYYIPSGIVPMALALEEMGMTRYSSAGTKNLFVRGHAGVGGALHGAKYAVISGEKWLSPSNAEDIKYITSPGNTEGALVKVVLISKAASEGLDFKCVRQIHVLDTWYNVNRIQQIVGRAVRNLSHCALPFEDRNVEIYLYASILAEESDEECMDLYVYRLAERKAVQIGKVTRLLKECSVDCMLNLGQTNFTAEKLGVLAANQNIRIRLASGGEVPFRVGDQPFSETCDYMESCEFSCSPARALEPGNVRTELYQSEFIKMNTDSIAKKIKNLFKERHVYTRKQLVGAINVVRQHPLEQIFFALSSLIGNRTERLVDRYGRTGTLENRGEYYVFQPAEITDANASVHDRSVPVPFRRKALTFDLAGMNAQGVSSDPGAIGASPARVAAGYAEVVAAVEASVGVARAHVRADARERWTWAMHASIVREVVERAHGVPPETFDRYIVDHELDSLQLAQKLSVLNAIYAPGWAARNESETAIRRYFDARVVAVGARLGVLLADADNVPALYVLSAPGESWSRAQPTDEDTDPPGAPPRNFGAALRTMVPRISSMAQHLGFFSCFKRKTLVFKIKDLSEIDNKQNRGFSAEQSGKAVIAKILNSLQTDVIYTHETISSISQVGICVVLEMVMRFLTEKTPARIVFLSQERAYLVRAQLTI
jgi:hypothetical protein